MHSRNFFFDSPNPPIQYAITLTATQMVEPRTKPTERGTRTRPLKPSAAKSTRARPSTATAVKSAPPAKPTAKSSCPAGQTTAGSGEALVDNLLRFDRVCLDSAVGGALVVRMWPQRTNDPRSTLCNRLTTFHVRAAFELCGRVASMAVSAATKMLLAYSLHPMPIRVSIMDNNEAYPLSGHAHLARAPIIRTTTNPGHALYLEGALDLFAQQEAAGANGSTTAYFSTLLIQPYFWNSTSLAEALREPSQFWALTMLDALFGSEHLPLRARARVLRAEQFALCVDKVFVQPGKLQTGHGAGWGSIRQGYLVGARDRMRALLRLPLPPAASVRYTSAERVLYTRADASRRRLVFGQVQPSAAQRALQLTRVVDALPHGVREQIAFFQSMDVLLMPHGAATANVVFMRPGALLIELLPTCIETCLLGCSEWTHPREAFAGLAMSKRTACAMLSSVYAPYHHGAGLRYHALYECIGGPPEPRKCSPAPHVAQGGRDKRSKYNHQRDITLTPALLGRIRKVLSGNGSASRESQVAPYKFAC